MKAYTGYLNPSYYAKLLEAERLRAKRERRAHRSLDRRIRLVADLCKLDDKLTDEMRRRLSKQRPHLMTRWLKQRVRIVRMLNA